LAVGGLLLVAQPAAAQTCIQDVWQAHGNNQRLTCTAQDVTLSEASNITIQTGGQCVNGTCECFAGQPLTFTADFRMDLTADTRYDIGFYIATDGDPNHDGARTGACSASASLASNTPAGNFVNLDASPDVCGDITGPLGTDHNPIFVHKQVSTTCPSAAGQQLVLPFCTTWRQPGSNQVCAGTGNGTTTNDVFPGSPSKCNCGDLAIDITSVQTDITVTKATTTTGVPETGGSANYSVTIANNNTSVAVTLVRTPAGAGLTDDKYGDITVVHAANQNCTGSATPGVCEAVTATTCVADANPATCQLGGSIAASGSCSCTFSGTVPPGDAGPADSRNTFTDVVSGCANNITNPTPSCKTDDATVPYTDVPQAPTLVKTAIDSQCVVDVTYTVGVTNTSAQDVLTLNTLTDDKYGSIVTAHAANASCNQGQATCGQVVSTTCGQAGGGGTLPATIAASGSYSCQFVGRINSCSLTLTDTVTGGAVDDDGQSYTPSDTATVVISVTFPSP